MPGILGGALLAFTLSLDDFVITFFTAGVGSTNLAAAHLFDGQARDHPGNQRDIQPAVTGIDGIGPDLGIPTMEGRWFSI